MSRHITDEELLRSLDGELPLRHEASVARHLGACDACRERVERVRAAMPDIRSFYRTEYGAPPETRGAARARLEAAMRESAADAGIAEQPWLQRASERLAGIRASRSAAVGAVLAACALAFIVVRAASEPVFGGLPPGALPQASLTPGAVSPLTAAELCNGVRPPRFVTTSVRQHVLRTYRAEHLPAASYELDALITPELGGSTDPANLWPQRYHSPVWNARVKDELERLLPAMVCNEEITLAEAQRAIATDWIAAYKRFFDTDTPLQAHLGPAEEEEDELFFVSDPPERVGTVASR